MSRCAIAVVVLLISSLAFGAEKRSELKFSYITSKSVGFVSAGGIPAVDLALELINNRTDVLPNHTLSYTNVLDSQVSEIWNYNVSSSMDWCMLSSSWIASRAMASCQ